MNYDTKSYHGIIFAAYLTKYNIGHIMKSFEYNFADEFAADYIMHNNELATEKLSNYHIGLAKAEMRECVDMCRYFDVKIITCMDKEYPKQLKQIKNYPPILFIKGKLKKQENVAVIGSRETSEYAHDSVRKVVELFADQKFGIVSGLALGIDSLAHMFAIMKKAYTISVLATPLNSIYPKENYGLAADILEHGGALISELPFGINRGRKSFVERNRIITGLSKFVFPIEMGLNSGTMSAVNFSRSQKRQLLLQRPNSSLANLKQLEGINHLIDEQNHKNDSKIKILEEGFTWHDIMSNESPTQRALFNE